MAKNTVLIAGVSGLVGYAAAKYFSRLPDWEVVGVARRQPLGLDGVRLLSVDLTNAAMCRDLLSNLSELTHVIYAALYEKPGLIQGWREEDQMQTNDLMLRNFFEPLRKGCKQLKHVSLLQGTKAYGAHLEPLRAPAREHESRYDLPNFYWLQEDYLREGANGSDWHWSILRPQLIFGKSFGSAMNLIPALGVYGAILKAQGEPLH